MIFNPSSHSFIYRKFDPIPPAASFKADYGATLPDDFQLLSVPNWLNSFNAVLNPSTSTLDFSLRLDENVALNLNHGNYQAQVRVRFKVSGLWQAPSTDVLTINLEVRDRTEVSLSPSAMQFNFFVGGSTPASQPLQVTGGHWTLTSSQTWVSFSQNNGGSNATVSVSVDPSGLPVGNHNALITLSSAAGTAQCTVVLTVQEESTESSYLYLDPLNIEIITEVGVDAVVSKPLSLDASHSWTATASESFVTVSALSGSPGQASLTVDANGDGLAAGNHFAQIVFEANDIIKTVFVLLKVLDIDITGFANDTLYFSDDRNKLIATNIDTNLFLVIDQVIESQTESYNNSRRAPYFQGRAELVIGAETPNLLKSVTPTNNFASRIKNNITPLVFGLTIFNEQFSNGSLTLAEQYQNLYFLTGKTPTTTDKLCYVPEVVYVTKDALLSLSLLADNNPTEIVITGDVTTTISASLDNDLFVYQAIINLSEFTLTTGNTLNIAFGTLSLDVVIIDSSPEERIIAFENEWKEYELFQTTGELKISPNAKKLSTEYQVEGEVHTKVLTIESGKEYVLDTGWIYTQQETDWLAKILNSKRIFIYEGTTPVEVELETKSLEVYKTREHFKSYSLKFIKAVV